MAHIIHSARRIDLGDAPAAGAPAPAGRDWVALDDGVLVAEGVGESWRALLPEAAAAEAELFSTDGAASERAGDDAPVISGVRVTDAGGKLLTAGWVDQHCHGGDGVAFDDEGDLAPAFEVHRAHGTRRLVASLVTNPLDVESAAASRVAAIAGEQPLLAGIHLEGPFLDNGHKGAHAPQFLRPAGLEEVQRLHDACGGMLKQVTLAPEHDQGFEATRWLVDHGVAVAVGHTSCTYDVALAAFDAGASILTHAFNGMPGLHHREPGPLGAALDSSHVTLELIADLVHVQPTLMRALFSMASGRVALITDAMSATGCSDGAYKLGSLDVTVKDGVARLDEGGSIAGSTLTMDEAVRRTVASGVSLGDAVSAATLTPAWAMGLDAFPGVGDPLDAFLIEADGRATAL